MQRWIPIGPFAPVRATPVFDEAILDFDKVPRGKVRQIGHCQMDGRNVRQAPFIVIESGCDSRESVHEPIERRRGAISANHETFELAPFPRDEVSILAFKERGSPEDQALLSTGEAQT